MAVGGKRLFWVSIIIVELVLVYVAYRPVRDHIRRSSHRAASAPRPARRPETPSSVAKNGSPATKSTPSGSAVNTASPAGKNNAPAAAKAGASKVVTAIAKPSPIPRPHPRPRPSGLVVSAGLKTPEPVPAKPAALAPTTENPLDSFWCRISKAEPDCDCKKGEAQASNRVMR
jgi:hypothetical protein